MINENKKREFPQDPETFIHDRCMAMTDLMQLAGSYKHNTAIYFTLIDTAMLFQQEIDEFEVREARIEMERLKIKIEDYFKKNQNEPR